MIIIILSYYFEMIILSLLTLGDTLSFLGDTFSCLCGCLPIVILGISLAR